MFVFVGFAVVVVVCWSSCPERYFVTFVMHMQKSSGLDLWCSSRCHDECFTFCVCFRSRVVVVNALVIVAGVVLCVVVLSVVVLCVLLLCF